MSKRKDDGGKTKKPASGRAKKNKPTDEPQGGYGKPPKHSQFKPGQSGNPKGRPKHQKNTKTVVHDVLNTPVRLTRNDTTTWVTAIDAVLYRLLDKAMGGDIRAAMAALKLNEKYDPEDLEPVIEAEVERRLAEIEEAASLERYAFFKDLSDEQLDAAEVLFGRVEYEGVDSQ